MVFVLAVIDDGRVARQQAPLRERVFGRQVLQMVAHVDALVGGVEHLGVAQQVGRTALLVVVQLVGPGIVALVEQEHVVGELHHPGRAVVPARIGPQEALVAPDIGVPPEMGPFLVVEIPQILRLDLERVHVELHASLESKEPLLRIVRAVAALDHVAVLVLERAPELEPGHAVLGVVGQALGAQRVAVLVEEFHQRTAEQGPVLIDPVEHLLALEHRLVLDELHVAIGLDEAAVHVPGRGVAQQVGVVVEETGMALHQAVVAAELLVLFGPFGLEQAEQAVFRCLLGPERRTAAQKEQHRQQHLSPCFHRPI